MGPIAHWDDVESYRREAGHIAATWTDLGIASGSVGIGVRRIQIDPGRWATPAHVHGSQEEIFVVLGGSGLSWQSGKTYAVGAGDCLLHLALREAHTLKAGPDGLDVLAFGSRSPETATHLPRAGASWLLPSWVIAGGAENHPFTREAAVGEPDTPEPGERPPTIVALESVAPVDRGRGRCRWTVRDIGRAAGSVHVGLRQYVLPVGTMGPPPHCHSAEEELFLVLDGEGTLLLGDEEHTVRRGHVVSRPPGTRVAHAFRGGEAGLTYLAFSDHDPNDIAYYPRSGKVYLRGVGVIGRLEQLDYWDGEEVE